MQKFLKSYNKTLDTFVTILLIFFLFIAGYALISHVVLDLEASANNYHKYAPNGVPDFKALRAKNPEVIAWIRIKGTKIDYPVCQHKNDNQFYVHHDAFKRPSLSGSIFLDSRNRNNFLNYYNVTYGHEMKSGDMYGGLEKFIKPKYFKSHKTGTLFVANGKKYKIKIFAFVKTDLSHAIYFTPLEMSNENPQLLNTIKKDSYCWRTPDKRGTIMAMSTCALETGTNARTILFAKLVQKK